MIQAKMALNIPGVAEPAKRVAERLAGKARFNTPQTRAAASEISASAERPKGAKRLTPC